MNMIRHGPAPERAGRLDVLLLPDGQHLAADDPATEAQPKKAMTMITTVRPGPMTETREMANSR